jgi:tripartite ATP-independent transporter DctM subunit
MIESLGDVLSILMFACTIGAVLIGYPVAFTLAGIALLFAFIGYGFGAFDMTYFAGLPPRYIGVMTNEVLIAVPLFIFMGVMLERSNIAGALLETMGQLFGAMRGGLGVSVIVVGTLLAASTGIVGATVVTMGLLSLPAMMKAGYDPKLATGIICASGTLGQIIPPSIVLILLADMLAGANMTAQLAKGNFTPEPVSVGQLFAAALFPGLILAGMYIVYVLVQAVINPKRCPALVMSVEERATLGGRVVTTLFPPLLLMVAVLGSILAGFATATEAASVGALGAILLAASKRELSWTQLKETMRSTLMVTSLVFAIVLGASVFSLVFRGLGGEELVHRVLAGMPGGVSGAVLSVLFFMFILGFLLDTFEILLIIVPITAPALLFMDIDPIWLGIMIAMVLQTSFLTPPVGFSLFYLRGVAPPMIKTGDIYRGVIPFVTLQVAGMAVLWMLPQSVTWLPDAIFGPPSAIAGETTPARSIDFGDGALERDPGDFIIDFGDDGGLDTAPDIDFGGGLDRDPTEE